MRGGMRYKKRKDYKKFDNKCVEAIVPQINKDIVTTPSQCRERYSELVRGEFYPSGIPTYVYRDNNQSTKAKFDLEFVFFDENEKAFSGNEIVHYLQEDNAQKQTFLQGKLDEIKDEIIQRAFVGYDIESQSIEPVDVGIEPDAYLLSHQFYAAHNGSRFGIIILTDRRFVESAFAAFVASLFQNNEAVKKIFVVAHYSIVEGGWMMQSTATRKGFRHSQQRSVRQIVADAKDPRVKAAIDAEDNFVKRIINHHFSGQIDENSGLALDATDVKCNGEVSLNQFARDVLDSYKTPEHAYHAVRGGYARYPINDDEEVPAIRISDALRDYYQSSSRDVTVFKKQNRTWAGRCQALSYNRRNALQKLTRKRVKEWRGLFNNEGEYGFDETVFMSLLYRNDVRCLNDSSVADGHWESVANKRKGKKTDERKVYEENCKKNVHNNASVSVEFCDTMHFSTDKGKSLKAFGELIGVAKLDVEEATYKEMHEFLDREPERFCRYGIRDSVIAAEAFAYFAWMFLFELDVPLATRTTGYSRNVFKDVLVGSDKREELGVYQKFIDNAEHNTPEKNLKHYLGFSRKRKTDKSGTFWWPSTQMQLFTRFYQGGWNDCRTVGPRGECTYWDLKSAYPTAILMLSNDYLFSNVRVYRGDAAKRKAAKMMADDNPFQIAGVELSYEFHDSCEPIFPTRFDSKHIPNLSLMEMSEQIIYTMSGYTHVGWPEYYVANKNDLLKTEHIQKLVTYEPINNCGSGSIFGKEIERLLRMRGEPGKKMIYKTLLLYLYGQTACGVDRRITLDSRGISEAKTKPGGLTCIPVAAYCTSFCRAVIGELLAMGNEAYAITTDGFISPEMNAENLAKGELALRTDAKLKELTRISDGTNLGYEFIEADFVAKRALFLKTRGYVLIGEDEKKDIKMAKMGVQVASNGPNDDDAYNPQVREFLEHLKAGEFEKKSWQGFSALKKDGRDDLPLPRVQKSRLSTTYDFKRMIVGDVSEEEFEYGDLKLRIPSFETAPLLDVEAFIALRTALQRNASVDEYNEMLAEVRDSGYLK